VTNRLCYQKLDECINLFNMGPENWGGTFKLGCPPRSCPNICLEKDVFIASCQVFRRVREHEA
jgi:hypothetical protein